MPVDFSGKWEFIRGENSMEFLEKFEPALADKLRAQDFTQMRMMMEVDQVGDQINTTLMRGDMVRVHDIVVGEESEHHLPNGRTFKGTPRWDGDKLVIAGVDKDGRSIEMIREFIDDKQVMTLGVYGIATNRIYKKM